MNLRLLGMLLAAVAVQTALADGQASEKDAAPASTPKMVAHRGAGDLTMPEASLPAYSNAIATACNIVKLDLRCTKDGVIVMGHDPTLKRNMGWDVEISSLDYAEILEKGRFLENGKPGNYRIVRLDEALAIVKAAPELWLDFKNFSPEMAEKVVKEIEKAGIDKSRLMVATFSKRALAYFRGHYPNIRRVGHFNITKERYPTNEEMRKAVMLFRDEYGLYGLNMPIAEKKTSLEDIAFLKGKGVWVSLWFVQSEKDGAYYLPASPDAFVTDHVSAVRKALGKK